ncbi:MAG: RNA-binding protein [Deltaproteobacteria bacterium]|nr:RNA-binding protein [Deltaproteobacteria bacterium]
MKIFVGNLSHEVKEEELNDLFSEHGRVSSVKIIRDMFSQASKGFGFVEMPGKAEAKKALDNLNTFELKGKKLVVNEAKPERNRRGGRKGSNRKGGPSGGRRRY